MRQLFLVEEQHGGGWDWSKGLREQDGFDEHAALMDQFVDEGLIVLGGPLSQRDVLLVVEAADENAVRDRFAEDPWIVNGMLTIARIRPWEILLDRATVSPSATETLVERNGGSDMLQVSHGAPEWSIVPAIREDAPEIWTLQRACWVQEQLANPGVEIPALRESLEDVIARLGTWDTYVVRSAGRLVAMVSGHLEGEVWDIGKLGVAPDLQGRGLGRLLLEHIQAAAPKSATSYSLFAAARSLDNLRMYEKAGFRLRSELPAPPGAVVLTKPRP